MARKKKDQQRESHEQGGSGAGSGPSGEAVEVRLNDVDALQERVRQLERERDELNEKLLRVGADYANFQRRSMRALEEMRSQACGEVAKTVLPVIDNIERALAAAESTSDVRALAAGVQIAHDQLLAALKQHGVEPMAVEAGEPFDPSGHQAMMQQASQEHPDKTVLQVIERGYTRDGQLLRPAKVIVSKGPEAAGEASGVGETGSEGGAEGEGRTGDSESANRLAEDEGD